MYVGETSQSLQKRIYGHRHGACQPETSEPVSKPFSPERHSPIDITISAPQGPVTDTSGRQAIEQKPFDEFDAHKWGLN